MSHWLPKVQTCVVLTKVFISWLMLWQKMPHKKLDFHSIQKGDSKASMLVWEEGVAEARNPGLVPRGLRKVPKGKSTHYNAESQRRSIHG